MRCYLRQGPRVILRAAEDGSDACHSSPPHLAAGGFTAAFLDEAFGLLFYSLRQHGLLPFISPAFTARLEVSFKKVL